MTTNIITATITAYCSCKLCCGPNAKGICANGQKPKEGITIAASRNIPLGSQSIIAGRVYTVHDRLAKRFDNRFDIYFAKHSDAKKFGIRTNQKVIVITRWNLFPNSHRVWKTLTLITRLPCRVRFVRTIGSVNALVWVGLPICLASRNRNTVTLSMTY